MKIDNIKFTDRLQPRVSIDFITVDEYAEAIKNGSSFPPIEVVYDNENYWMWDGFHRYEAAKKAGLDSFDVNITNGTLQDAEWLCLSANKNHGLHRTNADKQRSIILALQHPYSNNGKLKSHREIAEHCGVSNGFVSRIVKKITNVYDTQSKKNSQTQQSPTEKITPEALDLIKNTWIADSQQDIKDLATVKPEDQTEVVTLVLDGINNTIKQAKRKLKDLISIEKLKREVENEHQPTIVLSNALSFLDSVDSFDLLLTDPPYSTDVKDIYQFAEWLPVALSKIKPTGRAYIFIGAYPKELQAYLNQALPNQVLVWTYRNTIGPDRTREYKTNWQAILYYIGKKAPPLKGEMLKEKFSVLDFNAPDGRHGKRWHPWEKPLDLAEHLILQSTNENDIVVDPFAGTGTFLLAAGKTGRIAKGCDENQDQINIALQRGCTLG